MDFACCASVGMLGIASKADATQSWTEIDIVPLSAGRPKEKGREQ